MREVYKLTLIPDLSIFTQNITSDARFRNFLSGSMKKYDGYQSWRAA